MKIAFLWDWEPLTYQTLTWEDGLAAALKELIKRGNEVAVILPGKEDMIVEHPYFNIAVSSDVVALIKELKPEVILHWADMTRPHAKKLIELNIPQAVCFAGGDPVSYNTDIFQHIFVESQVYEDEFKAKGYPVSRAFGTNTDLFSPFPQAKLFDTIFPATFATWKRHHLYADATAGLRSLAVGYMYQDHEQECWQECVDKGITVSPHVSHEVLRYLYAASKVCVVPSLSMGGSQRTVLEAMAMDMPVIITDSNRFDFARGRVFEADPTAENMRQMINLALDSEVNTREYVLNNWSHVQYADALEEGLKSIL